MHGHFEKPFKNDTSISKHNIIRLLVLPVLAAIVLAAIMIIQPNAASWIAEAVQAEFVGDVPSVLPPTQFAQPAAEPHSVTTDWIARVQTD